MVRCSWKKKAASELINDIKCSDIFPLLIYHTRSILAITWISCTYGVTSFLRFCGPSLLLPVFGNKQAQLLFFMYADPLAALYDLERWDQLSPLECAEVASFVASAYFNHLEEESIERGTYHLSLVIISGSISLLRLLQCLFVFS